MESAPQKSLWQQNSSYSSKADGDNKLKTKGCIRFPHPGTNQCPGEQHSWISERLQVPTKSLL